MSCFYPLQAYRDGEGKVSLGKETKDSSTMQLPCGGCLGCRTAKAKGWAVRCLLEADDHECASFTTLTYSDDRLPPTLQKRDLSLFLKRLRKKARSRIRFFASGEYGEQTFRPHYHAVLFGVSVAESDRVDRAWGMGLTKTVAATPASIAYVAGYTAKKLDPKYVCQFDGDYIDWDTGELIYEWQNPFLQMSRRPGIGANARRFRDSWRSFALLNGAKVPVPKYLHSAWRDTASVDELELLDNDKWNASVTLDVRQLLAMEKHAIAKQALKADKRRL